jgi:hypothetical protein
VDLRFIILLTYLSSLCPRLRVNNFFVSELVLLLVVQFPFIDY